MTLLAKVAQPQTALRVFLFIFLLDINIFCTDAYISVQASHPDKTVCCMCARCIVICAQIPWQGPITWECLLESDLWCADCLSLTSDVQTACLWPLMCRLLVSELVSGDASLQIDAVTENIQCQNVFLYYTCNLHGSFCTAGIRGFQTLSPTSFLTLDSKPHLLPLFGLWAPPDSSLWTLSPTCFITLDSKPHLFFSH